MGIFRRSVLALLASGAMASVAAPETAEAQETQLDEVVIQAKKRKADESEPNTEKVGRTELQEKQVENFDDFGRRVDAGVNVNNTTGTINLRGLEGPRVQTTIDGIRVPWLTDPRDSARGGLNTFDFDGLSAIDITRGADSSRYGSGALGGVIQLRTLDPEDLIQEGRTFGGITKGSYDSVDESWRVNAAIAARANDTWLLVQGGYKQGHETDNKGTVDTYGSTRTEANPRDFDQGNVLVKLHQYVEGGHRFGLTGELYDRDDDIDNRAGTTSSYRQGSLKSGEAASRRRLSADYEYEAPDATGWIDRANVIAYWQEQKLNATTDGFRLPDGRSFAIPGDPFLYGFPTGVYLRDNKLDQAAYGLTGNGEKTFDTGTMTHTLRFGGEIYSEAVSQYSWGQDNCPDVDWTKIPDPMGPQTCRMIHSNSSDMPDVDSLAFGVFAEDDIALMNDRLTLTPGLRFDWYDRKPQDTPTFESSPNYDPAYLVSNSDSKLSPKLRAAWQATDKMQLYAQWAQAFRAPTALELYQNYGAPGSYARIGNPNLKPETSNGFEVGFNVEADDYRFSAAVFNNYYRNFIEQVMIAPPGGEYPVGGITGYANIARVQIYGGEVRGEWNFAPSWRTWGSLAYSVGKDTDSDAYLNSVPPLRAILGLGYAAANWGGDLSWTMAAKRDKVSGTGFQAPGYGILDATMWWQPKSLNGLKVQAGIFNILDQKYWNAVDVPINRGQPNDYYSEAGRSFRLTLTQTF
ncbi:MAG: TonB-dependent hemoglobin/transferrin/lactoferrin family receptor [Rhizobiaceae bacterium]